MGEGRSHSTRGPPGGFSLPAASGLLMRRIASARERPFLFLRRAIWVSRSAVTTMVCRLVCRCRLRTGAALRRSRRHWEFSFGDLCAQSRLFACDTGMDDAFELAPFGLVTENNAPERLAIERAVLIQDGLPEYFDDLSPGRFAWLRRRHRASPSASMTTAPHCLNILATVLLPVATPPVRPTRIMGAEHSTRLLASQPT